MSTELNAAIKEAMLAMLVKFNNRLNKAQMEPESKLADWADYLAFERKFKVSQVAVALETLMSSNTRFMPSAYEIANALKPKTQTSEDIGNQVANEVIQAVINYGVYRINEAYSSLSEMAKQTIGDNRYILTEIANSDQDSLPTIRAQIRNMVKASAELQGINQHNRKLAAIGISHDRNSLAVKPLPTNEMRVLSFDEFKGKDDL
jgi:hypothetical protein